MTAGASPTSSGFGGHSTRVERNERPWRALLAVPIGFAAVFTGIVVYMIATAVRDGLVTTPVDGPGGAGVAAHGSPPVLTLLSTLAQDLAIVVGVCIAVAASLGGRLRPALLGLRPARAWSAFWLVIGAYLLFVAVAAGWTSLLGITDRENVAVSLGTRDSAAALAGAIVLVCAVAPFAEELFFRGFLFGALRKYGLIPAAAITGVVFGLAHVASSPIGFIVPLAVLGVLLCLLYERTGSLYPPMALHCLNNSIAFGASDGRGWLVPVCLLGAGAAIVFFVWAMKRLFPAPAAAR
ncbi:MAG TPA: CPBP family intramembrane glutamic endopeptidase [Solirubrobacteraceae bacterium]|nr:CPBP family intramembrane glutamic endopeptidase [Solirubrobacteraceae bacterium]